MSATEIPTSPRSSTSIPLTARVKQVVKSASTRPGTFLQSVFVAERKGWLSEDEDDEDEEGVTRETSHRKNNKDVEGSLSFYIG